MLAVDFILLVVATISAVIILPIILLYRFIISTILRAKYGDNFYGLLRPFDNSWAVDISKGVVSSVMILSTKKTFDVFTKNFKDQLFNKCFKDPTVHPKFSCTRHAFFGCCFLLKCGFYEDVVDIYNVKGDKAIIDNNDLMDIVSEIIESDMPLKSKSFFQIVIIDKPIIAENSDDNYVVVIRLHHSLGDGFAISRFFYDFCSEYREENSHDFIEIAARQSKNVEKNRLSMANLVESFGDIIRYSLDKKSRRNILTQKRLSGEKITTWILEQDSAHFDMIKEIKKFYPGTSFSDVIYTAISAALSEHFSDHTDRSKFLTAYVPISFQLELNKKFELTNNFSEVTLNLPVFCANFQERLEKIKEQTHKSTRKGQIFFTHYFTKLISLFPSPILKPILSNLIDDAIVISILPGAKKATYFLEDTIHENTFSILPSSANLGMGFSVGTVRQRFQLVLVADKAVVSDKESSIQLLGSILKNFEEFYKIMKQEQKIMG